ncbi:MAG: lipoyl(octanoyl) transferase LipB [Saprospiraceae bacterium]
MEKTLILDDIGLIDYEQAWNYQTQVHNSLINQKKAKNVLMEQSHRLILCEHPHVYTLGKSGKEEHLVMPEEELSKINATYYRINRGGDITYHGPGQLVVYPILDLEQLFTDVHKYVRLLEESVIQTLMYYNIVGERVKEYTGVWLDVAGSNPRKICAIGVHLSRWVSLHGLAFNINSDLSYFNHIIPCGISSQDKSVTSLEKELGKKIDMEELKSLFVKNFGELFNLKIISKNDIG